MKPVLFFTLVVIGIVVITFAAIQKPEQTATNTPTALATATTPATLNPETGYNGTVLAGSTAPLLEFNQTDYDKTVTTDKLVVLYFYANWCPICKEEQPALYETFSTQTGDDTIGFRVSYKDNQTDKNEEELARKFGVGYQHTKVFVKNGERVFKSAPEAWSVNRYQKEIQKHL